MFTAAISENGAEPQGDGECGQEAAGALWGTWFWFADEWKTLPAAPFLEPAPLGQSALAPGVGPPGAGCFLVFRVVQRLTDV